MEKITKIYTCEVIKADETGGSIVISTPAVDRYKDRVFPAGAQIENYMKNPVVQWAHNYDDPWATIGNTERLVINENGITPDFIFREPAMETDPIHIIRSLWANGFIKAASIGFYSIKSETNEFGGLDFLEWELLEWSLVPIPANQEALRLAVKGFVGFNIDTSGDPPDNNDDDTKQPPGGETPLELSPEQLLEMKSIISTIKEKISDV